MSWACDQAQQGHVWVSEHQADPLLGLENEYSRVYRLHQPQNRAGVHGSVLLTRHHDQDWDWSQ